MKQAADDRARADEAEQQAAKDKAAAEAARGQVLESAAKEAEAEKAKLMEGARAEADKLRAAAKAEIEKMHTAAEAQNASQASALAVDIAARLFKRLPDSARVDGFVAGLAEAVGELPKNAQAEIGAKGAPVLLKSARRMNAGEVKACEAALSKALGREVTIKASTDSRLIAGLEIDTPHAAVRNSFRADLDRIAGELAGDGKG
jgi:F-type H+-transporting ATPase subunit b